VCSRIALKGPTVARTLQKVDCERAASEFQLRPGIPWTERRMLKLCRQAALAVRAGALHNLRSRRNECASRYFPCEARVLARDALIRNHPPPRGRG